MVFNLDTNEETPQVEDVPTPLLSTRCVREPFGFAPLKKVSGASRFPCPGEEERFHHTLLPSKSQHPQN